MLSGYKTKFIDQAQQEEQAEEANARELEKQLAFLGSEPHLDGM